MSEPIPRTTKEFLEAMKRHYGVKSDYALAKRWGKQLPTLRRWSKGGGHFGQAEAVECAMVLGLPPEYVLACMEAERQPNPSIRQHWIRLGAIARPQYSSYEAGLAKLKKTPVPRVAKAVILALALGAGMASPISGLRAESGDTSHGQAIPYAKYAAAQQRSRRRRSRVPERPAWRRRRTRRIQAA